MNAIIQKPLEFIARELDFRNDFKGRRTCDSEFKLTDVPLAIGNGVLYSSKLVYRLGGLGAAIGAVYGAATGDFDMVFVCAGMGGGTGTGGAPIVASVARDTGAIVIGTVTMPFKIEKARVDKAEFGLEQLRDVSDTVIVIDNNRLVNIAGNLPIQQAFAVANELIATMIKGIVETIALPSLVNLDYADVRAIMKNGGVAAIGVGSSDTTNKVDEAVKGALQNPLLDINYKGATGALIHIVGGPDMTLDDISKIGEQVTESLDADANVIWGARVEDDMKGKLTVMTIITGVKSPWILGKQNVLQPSPEVQQISEELGIEILDE